LIIINFVTKQSTDDSKKHTNCHIEFRHPSIEHVRCGEVEKMNYQLSIAVYRHKTNVKKILEYLSPLRADALRFKA